LITAAPFVDIAHGPKMRSLAEKQAVSRLVREVNCPMSAQLRRDQRLIPILRRIALLNYWQESSIHPPKAAGRVSFLA
jgi:hypothetical protein